MDTGRRREGPDTLPFLGDVCTHKGNQEEGVAALHSGAMVVAVDPSGGQMDYRIGPKGKKKPSSAYAATPMETQCNTPGIDIIGSQVSERSADPSDSPTESVGGGRTIT